MRERSFILTGSEGRSSPERTSGRADRLAEGSAGSVRSRLASPGRTEPPTRGGQGIGGSSPNTGGNPSPLCLPGRESSRRAARAFRNPRTFPGRRSAHREIDGSLEPSIAGPDDREISRVCSPRSASTRRAYGGDRPDQGRVHGRDGDGRER